MQSFWKLISGCRTMLSSEPSDGIEEAVVIDSEGLRLEGRLSYSASLGHAHRGALLLSPHPFLGGDMDSNVLKAIAAELAGRGVVVLSFNYRGIGRSQSNGPLENFQKEFWENSTCPGYEDKIFVDSQRAFHYLECVCPHARSRIVIGYSFGSLPALELASRQAGRIHKVGLISPPVAKWELSARSSQIRQDKAFFYSQDDFACPEDLLLKAYESFREPKSIQAFQTPGHFYLGQERLLAQKIAHWALSGQ